MDSLDESSAHGSIAARLVKTAQARAKDATVQDVRIGLGYTAVALSNDRGGVAFTFRDTAQGCCSAHDRTPPLTGRPAGELVTLLASSDPIEAAVGLATANALTNRDADGFLEGDVLDHLDVGPTDDVGMVGHFRPMVDALKERARSLTIYERVAAPRGQVRPAKQALVELPGVQIALITATSLLNHTLDELLQAANSCRQIAILGASTPLVPDVFIGTGVTLLSGVIVEDPSAVLRVVSEGGGVRQLRPHVRKVSSPVTQS